MHHIIYKTTNNLNGKYYIGAHKTDNLEDGYLGSGKTIIKAIKKYGKESFTREILFEASSEDEMYQKEAEFVDETIVNDPFSYNLKLGGSSNFYYVNKNGLNHKSNQHLKHAKKLQANTEYAAIFSQKMSVAAKKGSYVRTEEQKEAARRQMKALNEKRQGKRNHSEETKKRFLKV